MALSETKFNNLLSAICDTGKEILINTGKEAAENVVTLVDNVQKLEGGDRQGEISARALKFKLDYAATIASALQDKLIALFNDYQDFIGAKERARWPAAAAHAEVYQHWVDSNKTLKSRVPTYDTSPTEVGTGDHTIYRLTLDRDGYVIENAYLPLDIDLEVSADQQDQIERFEEQFQFGAANIKNLLENSGKFGGSARPLLSPLNRDSTFLKNHSFQLGQSGGSVIATPAAADFGSWEDPTGVYGSAKYAFDDTNVYRTAFEEKGGSKIPVALEVKGNHTLRQTLRGLRRGRPYLWSAEVMRLSSCDATVTLPVGSNSSAALDLTTISNDTFTRILPTLNQSLFPRNLVQDNLYMQIVGSGLSTGSWVIDALQFLEGTFFNGTWWWIIPGTTPALRGATPKKYTFEDVLAGADSIIQRILALLFGLYLTHTSDATQVTASGGRTLTFAASGKTITASSGSFVTDGYKVGMILTVAGTSSNDGALTLTNVTATVLTVSETVVNEGPLSATATLDATPSNPDP